jgi:hypothetical protein
MRDLTSFDEENVSNFPKCSNESSGEMPLPRIYPFSFRHVLKNMPLGKFEEKEVDQNIFMRTHFRTFPGFLNPLQELFPKRRI